MTCCALQFGTLTFYASGRIRMGTQVNVQAVVNNPASGTCPRSGNVLFSWQGANSGQLPPSPLDPNPANVNPIGAGGAQVAPGASGSAQYTWTPDPALIGAAPVFGCLVGAVSTNADICGSDNCPAVPRNPNAPYTICTTNFWVQAAANQTAVIIEFDRVTYFGFGVKVLEYKTRITAHALSHFAFSDFVVPARLQVAVGKPVDTGAHCNYHSGLVVPDRHVKLDTDFAPHVERRLRNDELQGALAIEWGNHSEGSRCMVEVCQEIAEGPQRGKIVGSFVVGLRHDAVNPIWL